MAVTETKDLPTNKTTCGSLLQQLQVMQFTLCLHIMIRSDQLDLKDDIIFQVIWDEVGESDEERDKMLLQLEQECLDVYRRKVDQASKSRAQLLQALADSRAELAGLLSALGEKTYISVVRKHLLLQPFNLSKNCFFRDLDFDTTANKANI